MLIRISTIRVVLFMTGSGVADLIADLFGNSNLPRGCLRNKKGPQIGGPIMGRWSRWPNRCSVHCVLALVFAGLGGVRFLGVFISTRITSMSLSLAFSGLWRPAAVHIAWPATISTSACLPPGSQKITFPGVSGIATEFG